MKKTHLVWLAVPTLSCTLLATIVAADDRTVPTSSLEVITVTISVDDLDVTSDRGARAAYSRIVDTAKKICLVPSERWRGARPAYRSRHAAQCFDSAVDEAVEEIRRTAGVDVEQIARVDRYALARLSPAR